MTRVLMVRHRHRPNAMTSAVSLTEALNERGIEVVDDASLGGIDMVLSIGGDGTFLVAASSARALDVPLLGINAGHMGFLTELGEKGTGDLARKIADGDFSVERRMTLDVTSRRIEGRRLGPQRSGCHAHRRGAPRPLCSRRRWPGSVNVRGGRHDPVHADRLHRLLVFCGWPGGVARYGGDRCCPFGGARSFHSSSRRRSVRVRRDRGSRRHVDASRDVV